GGFGRSRSSCSLGMSASLVLGACVGDDPAMANPPLDGGGGTETSTDTGSSSGDTGIVDAAKPCCDVTKPFGAPRKIQGLVAAGAADSVPFRTRDGPALDFPRDVG